MFWNIDSPETSFPNILPIPPPPDVSIFMHGSIQTIEPFSVFICSPRLKVHTTAGNGAPTISYCILSSFVRCRPVFRLRFGGKRHIQFVA